MEEIKTIPVLVTVVGGGVPSVRLFKDVESQELAFRAAVAELDCVLLPDDLRRGHAELRNNTSLWLTQAAPPADTEAGRKRLLEVRLLQMRPDAELDPEDVGLAGSHWVWIGSSGFTGIDAGRALDEFHNTVAISCLDDFETEVYADGVRIYESDDDDNND